MVTGPNETYLLDFKERYPELVFANEGYENIPKDVRARNQAGDDEITAWLKIHVENFVRFQNIVPRSDGSFAIRCQTQWSPWFQGVSYFPFAQFDQPVEPATQE